MPHLQRRTNPDEIPPQVAEQRRVSRHRARRRRSILRGVFIGAAVLFLVLLVLGLKLNLSWVVNRRRETAAENAAMAHADKPLPQAATDLTLSQAAIQGPPGARKIVGALHNKSQTTYHNVELNLFLRSGTGVGLGYATANVATVGPAADVSFQTTPIPDQAARYEFYGLTGTPAR